MKSTKPIDDGRKAQAMAALLAGQGVNAVSREYGLSKATVSRMKATVPEQMKQLGTEKQEEFGDLLMGYLRESLTTLTEQQMFFREKSWLTRQTADQLAVLHGVTVDKAIRLLEAIERAQVEPSAAE